MKKYAVDPDGSKCRTLASTELVYSDITVGEDVIVREDGAIILINWLSHRGETTIWAV